MSRERKKKRQKNWLPRKTSRESQLYREDTDMATNPRLKALILEVVENQLRENDPPEAQQTFERLLAAGYSRQEAMEMIGSALEEEIRAVLQENKPYNAVRYKAALEKLR